MWPSKRLRPDRVHMSKCAPYMVTTTCDSYDVIFVFATYSSMFFFVFPFRSLHLSLSLPLFLFWFSSFNSLLLFNFINLLSMCICALGIASHSTNVRARTIWPNAIYCGTINTRPCVEMSICGTYARHEKIQCELTRKTTQPSTQPAKS